MAGQLHILFVRHGETQDNIDKILQGWRDTSLTDNGHKDAQIVAEKLRHQQIESVYHSPLIRIQQTIQPILNDHPNVKAQSDPDLRGQGLGPKLEGGSYDLVDMGNPRSADVVQGVEKFNDFIARLRNFMARMIAVEAPLVREQTRTVVLGTHGVGITSIFKTLENTPDCDGFNPKLAERGPQAYEVRYPASQDVAKLVVAEPGKLPIREGMLEWEAIEGQPFLIEAWGRKEEAV